MSYSIIKQTTSNTYKKNVSTRLAENCSDARVSPSQHSMR